MRAAAAEIRCVECAPPLAVHDDLRRSVGLGLEQHRIHVNARWHPSGKRLQRLCAANFAAVRGDRSVVRHVLRLEGHHPQAAAYEKTRETGDDRRFARVRSGRLDHDRWRRRGHQDAVSFDIR